MRRLVSPVDLMLLGAVLLWAVNITVTRYVLTHGFPPLAYSTTRYLCATALFLGFTWRRERSLSVARSDRRNVVLAAGLIFLNQLCFVFSVHLTDASTVALLLGPTPIFVALIARAAGLERPGRSFWLAALVSLAGVAVLTASAKGGLSGSLLGELLGVATALTWAGYSVAVTPLMRRYSSFRTSALVLACGSLPLAAVGLPEVARDGFPRFDWQIALAVLFAIVGPLFLTNILWFTAIGRVGPSRASLFANLEPLLAVVFALLLLGEHLDGVELVGGAAIAVGVLLERVGRRTRAAAVLGE